MKKIILLLMLLYLSGNILGQGFSDIESKYHSSKTFTVDDLYKWRHQMDFKPKYFSSTTQFDNIILKMTWESCRQWYVEMAVTWYGYNDEGENNSHWFKFNDQLTQYYGPMKIDYVKQWFIPLYCFLYLDRWAYEKSNGKGL